MTVPKIEQGLKKGIEFKKPCKKTINKYLKRASTYAVQYTLRDLFQGPEVYMAVDKWGKRPIHVVSVNGFIVKDVRIKGLVTKKLERQEFVIGGFCRMRA